MSAGSSPCAVGAKTVQPSSSLAGARHSSALAAPANSSGVSANKMPRHLIIAPQRQRRLVHREAGCSLVIFRPNTHDDVEEAVCLGTTPLLSLASSPFLATKTEPVNVDFKH